ncbi:MAG: 1-deoxy-D-xylulose-5-phosphate synthase [SAR86 cluster bacterium]|uniref:1-deoxy-D-xylulose-5-phosphate synthase n=1 Tax=SAR86 cluster bacterium TaxID=2030880 RepID=A0A520MTI6_9GAMM|nr:MAG: 1-deoxy-D-xylulose-5-phosphate synthase [SAR86 cluster bacterium]
MKIYKEFPKDKPTSRFLDKVDFPSDLKKLDIEDLPILADELREFLLYTVSKTGGHFGAGLGAVELTIALHYVLDLPEDKIVWDTGHQAYPHKILSGRKDKMDKMRQLNGLAAFPSITESEYDAMSVGHSSTSISASLGLNEASQLLKDGKTVFSVIGDGAMTAGLAFEGLMHAGHLDRDLNIVLNDNDMSISKNKGGLSDYLAKVWASKSYKKLKSSGKKVIKNLPFGLHISRTLKDGLKSAVMPGNLFEDLGMHYIGPIDGHDVKLLVKTLQRMKEKTEPYLLHIITKKGAGFEPAENERIKFHAISKIETNSPVSKIKFQDIFGEWLCDKAEQDKKLVAITPAMTEGSGMVNFEKRFPERFYDVAIAEQHAVTFGAGLALGGMKPVVAIYSTFLQRAYDQLIHDVCLENTDVTFALDRAGIVGEDGPTHSGNFDVSFMRCIPNIVIATPSDENEMRILLNSCYEHKGPAAIRYPRGSGRGTEINKELSIAEIGKGRKIRDGEELCILNFGVLLDRAEEVANEFNYGLYDMRFVKPLDHQLIDNLAQKYTKIVTLEDHTTVGGSGSAVNEYLSQKKILKPVLNLGLKDVFPEHGSRNEILKLNGLDIDSLKEQISKF